MAERGLQQPGDSLASSVTMNNAPDLSEVPLPKKAFRPTAQEDSGRLPALIEEIRRENKHCGPAHATSPMVDLSRARKGGQKLDGLSRTRSSSLPLQ